MTLLDALEVRALTHLAIASAAEPPSAAPVHDAKISPSRTVHPLPPGRVQPTVKGGLPWHTQQDVKGLFESFAAKDDDKGVERPLRQPKSAELAKHTGDERRPSTSGGLPTAPLLAAAPASERPSTSTSMCRATSTSKLPPVSREKRGSSLPSLLELEARTSTAAAAKVENNEAASVECASFEAVIRLYFRRAREVEIEQMLTLCEPAYEALERRRWIARMRRTATDEIKQAFYAGDGDGSGMLSLAEFSEAVALHRGERHGVAQRAGVTGELEAAFKRADHDGNGLLDFDEFLEFVASNPGFVKSFDAILTIGSKRKARQEESRKSLIFRSCISPGSHCVVSPTTGRRRRPSLFDLRSGVRPPTSFA